MRHRFLAVVLLVAAFGPAGLWVESAAGADQAKKHRCTFVDALGEPIPGLHVQVFGRDKNGKKPLLKEMVLDEAGGVQDADLALGSRKGHCVVRHPDYGRAVAKEGDCRCSGGSKPRKYWVPLVRQDSNEYDRSIRGLLVDPEGKAVAGARIICHWIDGGVDVRLNSRSGAWVALTDRDGRFSMYVPVDRRKPGRLIPAHSKYTVMIEPPGDLGLALWSGKISNDHERTIVLPRGNRFRTFGFEDAHGPITEAEQLKKIRLTVEVFEYGTWSISYPGLRDGRVLPLGEVRAVMYEQDGWPGGVRTFEPILLTEGSPRHLVFRAKPEPAVKDIMYRGQVIHGISGEPMPGAFVLAGGPSEKDVSVLTDEQWDKLHGLPMRPSLKDAALKPLLRVRPAGAVVRTDEEGWFEMRIGSLKRFEFVAAFEQDYVAVPYYRESNRMFVPDDNDSVCLPAMKLYPGATVEFTPSLSHPKAKKAKIEAKWKLPKTGGADWLKDLTKLCRAAPRFLDDQRFGANRVNRMQIPADCDVRLRLKTHRTESWAPVLTDPIRAGQGQTIDIGRIRLKRLADLDLEGREVLVRVYEDWEQDRWGFETAKSTIEGRMIHFDLDYPDGQVVLVVTADDQNDPNVKEGLGATVYASLYREGLSYNLAKYFGKSDRVRTLVDALGNPIVGATAKIYLKRGARTIGLSEVVLEETNLLRVPNIGGSLLDAGIVIEHPAYGRAAGQVWRQERGGKMFFAALKQDCTEYEHSIWGTVVDPEGIAVPGVSIKGRTVHVPGKGEVSCERSYEVLTDEQGRFSMYLPVPLGKLIPLGSEYAVSVSPPKDLGLRGPGGTISNGRETTIVLRPKGAELGYFHTFSFEDKDGPITDVERLKKIVIRIHGERESPDYIYYWWKDGRKFGLGEYRAGMKGTDIRLMFEPIMVTEDSPEHLVFKATYPKYTYRGRVVDAITGQGLGKVSVICLIGSVNQAVLRTAEQFKSLHVIGHDIAGDANTLAELAAPSKISKLTLTDEQGRYEVTYEPGKDKYFWNFAGVEAGYFGGCQSRTPLKPGPDNQIGVPDIELFPTARIFLQPYQEDRTGWLSVRSTWRICAKDNSSWEGSLPHRRGSILASANTVVSMDVPAELNVRVGLFVDESKEKANPRWSPIIIEGLNLDAGERRDLGKLRFERTYRIYARVVDSGGRPVEDLTVRHVNDKFIRTYRASTDGEGMARFSGPPYSRGKFKVLVGKEKDPQFEQVTSYEIAGPEDANAVFTLELSDEILEVLFR